MSSLKASPDPDVSHDVAVQRQQARRARIENLVMLACWMIASGLYATCLGKDVNYDMRNYHIYNPFALLHGRIGHDIMPAGIQSYLNPLMDVPFYLMMRTLPALLTGFLVGAVQGLNGWLLTLITRRALEHRGPRIALALGILAGVVGYSGAMNRSEIGAIFGDNLVSIFVLAAVWFVPSFLGGSGTRRERSALVLSGLVIGAACGLKMTAMIYAVALTGAILLARDATWSDRVRRLAWFGAATIAGFLLTAGYWMVIMQEHFHSPLFPFYNGIFRSEYFDAMNLADDRSMPRDLLQTLFYPFYFMRRNDLVSEVEFRDIRLAVMFVLAALVPVVSRLRWRAKEPTPSAAPTQDGGTARWRPQVRFLLIFNILAYIVWEAQFSIYRYLVPLELLSITLIILLLDRLLMSNRIFIGAAVALSAIIALVVVAPNWGRTDWERTYFSVDSSVVSDLEHGVVVMDRGPFAYLIPFLPRSATYIQLEERIIDHFKPLKERARETLSQAKGSIYALTLHSDSDEFGRVLAEYGLAISAGQCEALRATANPSDLALCRCERVGVSSEPVLDFVVRP